MLEIKFERDVDSILAQADDDGIWINFGWMIPIPRAKAVEYFQNYNKNSNAGFFEHAGNVILTHNGGKMTFSPQEADALLDLIKAAYPEA